MALLLHAPLRARAAPFAGSRVALRASAAPRVVSARAPPRSPVAGLFDFLNKPEPEAASSKLAYICIDCGYIYKCVLPGGAEASFSRSANALRALMDRALRADAARAQRRHQPRELLLQVPGTVPHRRAGLLALA